ncbi:MAG: YggS family pyridoxal phosphate-dependent enzyme [Chloroflexota bacterium]|nr:YggS family pyridoxal phosphate-dependent enzyme [Chloroflexota bacterium]MDE2920469.1 YggS family pyridoxal phosphate-dependent enzyme [Chloroflexota bacterium]
MTQVDAAAGIAARVAMIRARIAAVCREASRSPDSVTLVAVCKTFGAETVRHGLAAGLSELGENRVQEAQAKIPQVGGGRWHLVGHLQRNKARVATQLFSLIHSVDSVRLARRLEAVRESRPCDVLIQINLTGAQTQGGIEPLGLSELASVIDRETGLTLRGLMTIGPIGSDVAASRACFRRLRDERDALRVSLPNQPIAELSMGMTDDLDAALVEGATIIRVGRAIFGARSSAPGS